MLIQKSIFKSIIYKCFINLSKIIIPMFFDKKYLKGRWFTESSIGWIWGWNGILWQKILGFNRNVPWPVSFRVKLGNKWDNILFDVDDLHNFHGFGVYFQSFSAKIVIGKGCYVGPNVGLITANHNPFNLDEHLPGKDIVLGKKCWLGMNSVILPGVVLGDYTIVGAGSVVTKSFPEGYCAIAGSPAKVIKKLN